LRVASRSDSRGTARRATRCGTLSRQWLRDR